jgi:hypothetical protein
MLVTYLQWRVELMTFALPLAALSEPLLLVSHRNPSDLQNNPLRAPERLLKNPVLQPQQQNPRIPSSGSTDLSLRATWAVLAL